MKKNIPVILGVLTVLICLPTYSSGHFLFKHSLKDLKAANQLLKNDYIKSAELSINTLVNNNLINSSAEDPVKEMQSKITSVTVFLHGAQVTREAEIQLSQGKTVLKLAGISPYIDERSIQVKGEGAFTVLSVNYKKDFLKSMEEIPEVKELIQKIDELEKKTEEEKNILEILKEKQSFLVTNKNIGGKEQALLPENFRLLYDLYSKNIDQVKSELLEKQRIIRDNEKMLTKLKQQLGEHQNKREMPKSEIYITVSSKLQLNAKFTISYMVDGAGWFPSYDIRIDHIDQPVGLVYKANVFQKTGVEWKNVELTFSNASPELSGNIPVPVPYYLDFIQNIPFVRSLAPATSYSGAANGIVRDESGNPLPGVSVSVSGTSIGTITDAEGRFSLNVPAGTGLLEFHYIGYKKNILQPGQNLKVILSEDQQSLDEKIVTGYGLKKIVMAEEAEALKSEPPVLRNIPIEVEIGKKRTSVEFRIEVPYTIPSESKSTSIDMLNLSLPADFQYRSVPKLDTDAFLMARVKNWEQYDLLEGEANLYFENTFVGKSVLNTRFVSDTLDISLGRDMGVIVKREKRIDFTSRKFIGNNKIETRSWEISVRNNKKESIKIEITDFVPVSMNKDIQVEIIELSGGTLDKDKGFVTWTADLEPGKSKSIILSYSVRYPKDRSLHVE